ncbi:MAG TPA: glycosyltransferase [Pseudomonas xinjiangensis]|uniref:Glycosyltransferase n=2 Tax=root TaxID=1 RepID=A0A7V1BRL3_9GAMM|nr:glycosyltransferase [Halopseudomonas xinjiangensis]HEC47900.1 glycosyltransferase [Halopseudomonas xinjiangensis]
MKAFDIDFYDGSKEELIREIVDISEREFSYIVTPNVNHVVQLEHDEGLKKAYVKALHRVCDSRVLLPFLRAQGAQVQEAIPGSTLTADLIVLADKHRWKVCVIGCEPANMTRLQDRFPGITFYHYYPPMGFINDQGAVEACLAFIAAHPSRLVVLALGCTTQEVLALKILEAENATGVGLCVGGSLNFLSGSVPRAPRWVQQISLEWLHRVCTEPRRLTGRYARDAWRFVPILIRQLRQSTSLFGVKQ